MTETYLPPRQPPVPPWTYPGSGYLPPEPPQPPKKNRFRRNTVALLAAATLAAGGIGGTVGALVAGDDGATTPTSTSAPAANTSDTTPLDVSSVVAKVKDSVVQVNMRTANAEGIGSGVIISADGRILTNNHVVSGAQELSVTLADGRTVEASVVGTDPSSDLAVIQAKGVSGLTAATFGDSNSVKVGDEVIAIGSPGGLQNTVTTGIVSALDRDVSVPAEEQQQQQESPFPYTENGQGGQGGNGNTVTYKAIQTDASINQGNSGGPLFNAAGEVVGINSAIYSPVSTPDGSAGSVGIGFAIPSDTAKQVADQL
jgi:putative serine protease PepD